MNNLRNFYNNENERESVKEFMIECLKEMAHERAFAGESVAGISEARELVEKMFDKLEQMFRIKPEQKEISSR